MDIPGVLLNHVREGRAVLVFGAGASYGATGRGGAKPPDGKELGRLLNDRFLDGKYPNAALSQIGEYAISESSLVAVQEFIRELLQDFEPAPFHTLLPKFRWHGLATTNYDRIIEKAYERDKHRLQNLMPIVTDDDRIQDAQHSPDNVLLLKLHGCISRTNDAKCPLILTTDQYVQYKAGRKRLFSKLEEWAYERPLVFLGHSIQDADLRALFLELSHLGENRERAFAIAPGADAVAQRFWETKKLTVLDATFQDFLETLDAKITANARVLAGVLRPQEPHPIGARFKKPDISLSESCRNFLSTDVEFVGASKADYVDPPLFYRGMNSGWACVEQGLDVRRKLVDTILIDVVLADAGDRPQLGPEVILIKGHAGSGKSVLLRRVAWDAAHDYKAVALYLKPQGAIVSSALKELLAAIDDRIYLFVDDAADRLRELNTLLREIGVDGKRLTIVMAERINEWNVGGSDALITDEFTIPYLDHAEIEGLIALLEKHKALGTLEKATAPQRLAAFEQHAGRQLLVALHEATLGRPFVDIIRDEYDHIIPTDAQQMYLSVCVLNRLNVPVRAGVIARMHDLPFGYFREKFFKPLEHVVQTSYDSLLRDHTYEARHPHIADIVFESVLVNPEDRLEKYLRCLCALNIDFSTDERAFRQMVRGKVVQDLFPQPDMARQVFRAALETVGEEPFLLQQLALYEMASPTGSLERASEWLDKAANAAPHDFTIKHSKAELLLRLVDIARTSLERDQRLREAMQVAVSLRDDRTGRVSGSHALHTIVKVSLKRLEGLIDAPPDEVVSEETLSATIKSVEESLQDGLQRFPEDSYLRFSEAQLATRLGNSARAIKAMRSAFKTNPRNGFIAIRLAKSLEASGDVADARIILKTALDNNQVDKKLHYALGRFLMQHEPHQADEIEYHLQRSFTKGDTNYDAQVLYGRQLYMKNNIDGSKEIFKNLSGARVAPDLRQPRYPLEGWFRGRIKKIEATYGFAVRDGVGDWVFFHRKAVAPDMWEALQPGYRVRFRIAFTLKGQTALELSPEQNG